MRCLTLLFAVVAMSCGSNPSANASAYCAELSARFCDQAISCNQFAASHRAECVDSLRLNLCGVRANESSRGLVKLNEKLTARCLADFKSTGCTREGSALGSACFASVEPAVASGGKCETDSHCRDLNQRCIGVGCDRTCQNAGASGEACRPTGAGTGSCNPGLTCDADGKCSRGGATGADCSTAIPCNPDNTCDNVSDKCVALPGTGQACRLGFPQCAEAAFCSGLSCAARLSAGAMCFGSNQCLVGTSCRAGTCQALAAEGATCAVSSDCVAGTLCDNVALTCQKLKRAFFEEACSSTSPCQFGLACRNVKPARMGTAGSTGVCGVPVAGDSCFSSAVCLPGTVCQLPATPGEPGTCTASATAQTCGQDRDCPEAEACHASDRKCGSRSGIGGSCAQLACIPTAQCVQRGAARICVELADLSATCSNDMVQAIPCRSPLLCARTTCISAGRKGEACLGGPTGSCFAGACNDGVCGDLRPDGATCKQDTDCGSSACERGICIQACR